MVSQGYPPFDDDSTILHKVFHMLFMLYIIRYYIYTYKISYNNTSMN